MSLQRRALVFAAGLIVAGLGLPGGALAAAAVGPLSPYAAVDLFIGTGADGHTVPGATTPFGMALWSRIRVRGDGTVTGTRETRGWAPGRQLLSTLRFSQPPGRRELMAPGRSMDVDGGYCGPNNQVHHAFVSTSLWDACRAEQPLMTPIEPPARTADVVRSPVAQLRPYSMTSYPG